MNFILFLLFNIFIINLIVYAYENECIYPWNNRIDEPKQCKDVSDCNDKNSNCIFSPHLNNYICCTNKKGAIKPECPNGMLLTMGKNTDIILCDKNVGGSLEDQCPYNFKCVESITNFTKNPGQSNFVCCIDK